MSKLTILLISPTTLGRVDLRTGKSPNVQQVWQRASIEGATLGTLVDTALRLGKNRKRNILVATTRCWSGTVAVAPELLRDASSEEKSQTIALEAEPFSGISAFDGMSFSRPLPPAESGDLRFWVSQIPRGDFNDIENAVRTAGGQLLAVGHPAVLTVTEPAAADSKWQSLQTWDGTTLAARGIGGAIEDMLTITTGIQSPRTRQSLETFFPSHSDSEQQLPLEWIGLQELPASLETLDAAQNLLPTDLSQETDLGRWAVAWTQLRTAGGLPTIAAPKKPMSKEASVAIAAVLGLAMMGACYGHYRYLNDELAKHDATIEQSRQDAAQLKKEQDQLKGVEEKRDKLIADIDAIRQESNQLRKKLTAATKIIRESRVRWLKLVDVIVDVSEDSSWVNEIQGGDGEVTLAGLAIDDAAVHRFASDISKSLQSYGWTALPADTEVDPDSSLIRFAIALSADGPQK